MQLGNQQEGLFDVGNSEDSGVVFYRLKPVCCNRSKNTFLWLVTKVWAMVPR